MDNESRVDGGTDAQVPVEKSRGNEATLSRRTFAVGMGSTLALLGLGALRYVGSVPQVRPPGGQDEVALTSRCIHCNRCVEACPVDLLKPASIEAGVLNMRTPYMDFSDNYPGVLEAMKFCDFCTEANGGYPLCVEVCPSSALDLAGDFDPDTHVIGVAELDKDLCIAYRSGWCAFCYDACIQVRGEENAAIYYKNAESLSDDSTRVPVIDPDKCNGCGACESVCVSAQAGSTLNAKERAIVVRPLEM